ncbi:MAG: hypothetical protein PHS60_10685 [Zavarzinia sp.]|nr:hypothetical protein [Zavarzinia sp.]
MRSIVARSALAVILAGLVPAGASAGTIGFDVVHQGTAHEAFFCMSAEKDAMIAVGAPNLLFDSTDAGKSWSLNTAVKADGALFGCRLKHGVGLVVGQMGLILRQEGGVWSEVPKVTDARLFAVDMNARGLAVAVGAFGTILVSTDAGKNWSRVDYDWSTTNTEGFEPHIYGVTVAEDGAVTISGEFAAILRSTDAGNTWSVVNTGTASLFDVVIDGDGIGFAVGQDGLVLRTADSGLTWSKVASGVTSNLLGIERDGAGHVLVTGMRSLLIGTDDGSALKAILPGDVATGWYQGIVDSGKGTWLLAGQAGRLVRVIDNETK